MTRVIFFTDTEWSLGRFYTELAKRLWSHNIDCHILFWSKSYSKEEIQEQIATTDFWVSTPHAIQILHEDYGVPLEKCIVIMYHTIDVNNIEKYIEINKVARITTVASWLQNLCLNWSRVPSLTQIGINANTFKTQPAKELKTLGFGAVYASRELTQEWKNDPKINTQPRVFKRGYLVKEIADELNLPLRIATNYHATYVTMPGFYNSVDCVICASEDEGAGGPVAEAGAAGRLVITTNVGAYKDIITEKGADGVSVSEEDFKNETILLLKYYINNPKAYQNRCQEIQEYALKTYDHENYIEQWVNLLKKK